MGTKDDEYDYLFKGEGVMILANYMYLTVAVKLYASESASGFNVLFPNFLSFNYGQVICRNNAGVEFLRCHHKKVQDSLFDLS